MRTKVTLVLLLLNVALFFYIFYFERGKAFEPPTRHPVGPEAAAIEHLEIRRAGEAAPLVLAKRGDGWKLGAPYDWPANRNAVERLLNELTLLEHETSFRVDELANTGQSLADYGLEPAALTLVFGHADKRTELRIGAVTQVGNRLYLLSPDGKRIHVVNRSLLDSLAFTADTIRADTLFDIPVFEARSLVVQLASQSAAVRVTRSGDRWLLESPLQTRGDRTAVELLLNRLNTLHVSSFRDRAAEDLRATGLDTPSIRVTVEGNQRSQTLYLGAPVPAGDPHTAPEGSTAFFAQLVERATDRSTVFTVSLDDLLLASLRGAQTELRDRHVLDFDRTAVTALEVRAPGQPEVTLQRLETGAWQVLARAGAEAAAPQPAAQAVADRVVQELAALTAVEFLKDVPSAAELETWGFNRPTREVVLTLAGPAGGPAPAALTLALGDALERGGLRLRYARASNAGYVYLVRAAILDELPATPLAYRERVLRTLPPGARITGFSLRDLRDDRVVLARELTDAAATWEAALAADRPEIRQAVATLLEECRVLRARSFSRDHFTESCEYNGETRPWRYRLEITITLTGAGDQTSKVASGVVLSERLGGATLLVGSAEFNTVFESTQEFLDAVWALTFGERDPGPPPATP